MADNRGEVDKDARGRTAQSDFTGQSDGMPEQGEPGPSMRDARLLKIVHVIKHCELANGNVAAAVDLACAQKAVGLDVSFVSSGGALEALLDVRGIATFRIPDTGRSPVEALRAEWALISIMRRLRPDIIHSHMLSSQLLSLIPGRLVGAKLVTTVHNAFEPNARLMGCSDLAIAVSTSSAEDLVQRGFRRSRLRVVRNGPIGSPRLPSPTSVLPLRHPAILTVCGLHPRKRVEDIIVAAASVLEQVPEAHVYIAGEGPDDERLRHLAHKLGLANSVHFVGMQSNPLPWMRAADIFVLASDAEPFGLVLAEARSQGCALIATNVDGIPEVLEHGRAGILIPPRSPQLLASAIITLLTNPSQLKEFKVRASTGVAWLSVDRMEREVRKLYYELTQQTDKY